MKVAKTVEEFETISPATGKPQLRRIVVLQRDDGHYSLSEENYYTAEHDGQSVAEGWQRLWVEGVFASAALAEAEVPYRK